MGQQPGENYYRTAAGDDAHRRRSAAWLNIWVTNQTGNNVTKLQASDGTNLGTFAVGNHPFGIAFDGANVWVANYWDNFVSKR